MARYGIYATLDRDGWQTLVDVLDGCTDRHAREAAQDALTRAAPIAWLAEAEAAEDA